MHEKAAYQVLLIRHIFFFVKMMKVTLCFRFLFI